MRQAVLFSKRAWRGLLRPSHRAMSTVAVDRAFLHDVTPRDGLQNEKTVLDVDQKLLLIEKIVAANPASIEIASFVRGDLVPAMAGAQELCQALHEADWAVQARSRGMSFMGLVPNMKGYENFKKASEKEGTDLRILDTVVCLVSCTESHSMANVNMPMKTALETTCEIVEQAKKDGFKVRAYASLAFGCPFEGEVSKEVVKEITERYVHSGADTVILADTLGQADPLQVDDLVPMVLDVLPKERVGLHMHNAHGKALLSIYRALNLGIQHFDSSIGGAGGCNFLGGDARGNISSQQVLGGLNHLSIPHGINSLDDVNSYLQHALGRPLENDYSPNPELGEMGTLSSSHL